MSVTDHQALLSIYSLGDKAYGLTILKAIAEQCGREPSIGAVYTTLDRLEQNGLVESRLGEVTPERGWRAKKYFTLTDAGRNAITIDDGVTTKAVHIKSIWPWVQENPDCFVSDDYSIIEYPNAGYTVTGDGDIVKPDGTQFDPGEVVTISYEHLAIAKPRKKRARGVTTHSTQGQRRKWGSWFFPRHAG
jgi:hypothetical protein